MNATLLEVLARHWGFASFRPLQSEAMEAALGGRDTLVVMPTGGGKSLCYQAPAIVNGSLTVVVSPLISLMKDQVDGLAACGVAAAQLNSSQSSVEQRNVERALNERKLRLLFVSPERLAMPNFRQLLGRAGVMSPEFPKGYWPASREPRSDAAWDESVAKFRADRDALAAIVSDESIDLFAKIPHGKATMLAQILLAADHNTYHLGQLVLVRKILTSE